MREDHPVSPRQVGCGLVDIGVGGEDERVESALTHPRIDELLAQRHQRSQAAGEERMAARILQPGPSTVDGVGEPVRLVAEALIAVRQCAGAQRVDLT